MDGRWITFLVASAVLVAIPGPSVTFAISRALVVGRRRALAGVLGNATGVYLQVVAVAVGLGQLVERSATVFTVVKLVGAVYLVYLGVAAVRHRHETVAALGRPDAAVVARSAGRCAIDGVLVGGLNPKTIVFFLAFLPPFLDPSAPAVPQLLTLGAVFAGIAVVLDTGWVLAASGARAWFGRSPRRLGAMVAGAGVTVIGLGVGVAVTSRPT